ncbi:deoxynucleoside kinase [Streptomyces sp. 147326]|uniref:deoxynucleoside kinase n=1 Tax=Streptomyces sp. 147326 TaxID=3074379 RepID=UPI0038575F9C
MTAAPDAYDITTPVARTGRGLYVAVSGNTSGGKSTLVEQLRRELDADGVPAIGVSERAFHHRFLPLMFSRSSEFAFPIQLSFMLERHMVLLRNLALGRTVVMERSHLDDILFVREHAAAGNIAADQFAAYRGLAHVLHARIPAPDVLVLMNPPAEVSLKRLAAAEEAGERPREFPDEAAKRGWVERWHEMYEDLHAQFRERRANDPEFARVSLLEVDPEAPAGSAVPEVLTAIREKRGLRSR